MFDFLDAYYTIGMICAGTLILRIVFRGTSKQDPADPEEDE